MAGVVTARALSAMNRRRRPTTLPPGLHGNQGADRRCETTILCRGVVGWHLLRITSVVGGGHQDRDASMPLCEATCIGPTQRSALRRLYNPWQPSRHSPRWAVDLWLCVAAFRRFCPYTGYRNRASCGVALSIGARNGVSNPDQAAIRKVGLSGEGRMYRATFLRWDQTKGLILRLAVARTEGCAATIATTAQRARSVTSRAYPPDAPERATHG